MHATCYAFQADTVLSMTRRFKQAYISSVLPHFTVDSSTTNSRFLVHITEIACTHTSKSTSKQVQAQQDQKIIGDVRGGGVLLLHFMICHSNKCHRPIGGG